MPVEHENREDTKTFSSITAQGITSILMIKVWQSNLMTQPTGTYSSSLVVR